MEKKEQNKYSPIKLADDVLAQVSGGVAGAVSNVTAQQDNIADIVSCTPDENLPTQFPDTLMPVGAIMEA